MYKEVISNKHWIVGNGIVNKLETVNYKHIGGSVFIFVSTLAKDSNLTKEEKEELMRIIDKIENS